MQRIPIDPDYLDSIRDEVEEERKSKNQSIRSRVAGRANEIHDLLQSMVDWFGEEECIYNDSELADHCRELVAKLNDSED